ncbi:MAG: GntR family transcriptional regulator [Imperialibacter sp.]|uniref:GntR family transcriptional regulator n=1 Tax=Imperialibacter sp. TaxID=2038411 RepID=UPI0032EEAA8C
MEELLLDIKEKSSVPKYKQIVGSVISSIEAGKIKYGQKLPSINQVSYDYLLARDTVEKAYNELKELGVIAAVKGKGYYISNSAPKSQLKVLMLFNKLSTYKKEIYNSIVHELGEKAHIDFFVYHCDFELFEKVLNEHLTGYSYFVLMPHFTDLDVEKLNALLSKIPREKIIILDNRIEGVSHFNGCVYQDFKMDIYNALSEAKEKLSRYKKLILVFPENETYPYTRDIVIGFRRFCGFSNVLHEIISEIGSEHVIESKTAYVVIEESDLVNLIKLQRANGMELAKDVGIVSYNDTPLKEVLSDGISVITTDFRKMGQLAAKAMLENSPIEVKNDFRFIERKSV